MKNFSKVLISYISTLFIMINISSCFILETPSKSQAHKLTESCITNLSGCIPTIATLVASTTTATTTTTTKTPAPIMSIFETTIYSSGSAYDFGSVYLESSSAKTFTINNLGTATLNLTGSEIISISGTGTSVFHITHPTVTSISAGSSTSFIITFGSTGNTNSYTADISIANDDTNNNPYTLKLSGSGSNVVPP